jgi:hypothetical protein
MNKPFTLSVTAWLSVFCVFDTLPAMCAPVTFRPGLWKMTFPGQPDRDRCVLEEPVTNWIFNPDTWPLDACTEKLTFESATEKVVNIVCSESPDKLYPWTYNGTFHFLMNKAGTPVIDRYQYIQGYAVTQPSGDKRVFMSKPFMSVWAETDCGSAFVIHNFPPDMSGVGPDGLGPPRKVLR